MCDRVVLRLFLGSGVPFSLVMPTDVLMYTVHSWKRRWTPPKLVKIHGTFRCFSFSKHMFRLFRLQSLVVQMILIHFAGNFCEFPQGSTNRTLPLHHGFNYQNNPGIWCIFFAGFPSLVYGWMSRFLQEQCCRSGDVFVGRRGTKIHPEIHGFSVGKLRCISVYPRFS